MNGYDEARYNAIMDYDYTKDMDDEEENDRLNQLEREQKEQKKSA